MLSERLVQGMCPGKVRKMPHGGMGLAAPKFSLLSSSPICYTSNMSGQQILQGAQNVVIRGGTFMAAGAVCDALQFLLSLAN